MAVRVGSSVPSIELEAWLHDAPGPVSFDPAASRDGWLVLVFYPRDFTFVCPTELAAFAELADDFAREEAEIVAVSTDSYWSHRAWYGTQPMLTGVRYPVAADTAHVLSRAFDVLTEDGSALRGTFLIDPDGIVRHASVTDQTVGRNPVETLRLLQALRTGELCPVGWKPGDPTLLAA